MKPGEYKIDDYGTHKIIESTTEKFFRSPEYNYNFDKTNGYFERYGKKMEDDPTWSPNGPEILDFEVSTICDNNCSFCYKSSSANGKNTSLEDFKKIFHNMPRTLNQIAFGADAKATANPHLFDMMRYCRDNDYQEIIPNITVADISPDVADQLAKYCGAVAVSRYNPPDICYDSVKLLTDRGMKQVNIHMMICEERYEECLQVLEDACTDPRLENLNAVVFLALKRKGRGTSMTPLRSKKKYRKLIDQAFKMGVGIGFDSCSAHDFLMVMQDSPDYAQLEMISEACESGSFSSYINTEGKYYPCSFAEEGEGLDVLNCGDFVQDIWNNPSTVDFRKRLLETEKCSKIGCRSCPLFDIELIEEG